MQLRKMAEFGFFKKSRTKIKVKRFCFWLFFFFMYI